MTLLEIETYFYESEGKLYWNINKGRRAKIGGLVGTLSNKNYLTVEVNNRHYQVHRILYQIYHKLSVLDDNLQIDHIDGVKRNNISSNLRLCNNAQNKMNSKKYATNTSGHKNITYSNFIDKRNNNRKEYWTVYVTAYTKKHCKRFPYTDEGKALAIIHRNKLINELHGEFGNIE